MVLGGGVHGRAMAAGGSWAPLNLTLKETNTITHRTTEPLVAPLAQSAVVYIDFSNKSKIDEKLI